VNTDIAPQDWPAPAQWSMLAGDAGRILLFLAMASFLAAVIGSITNRLRVSRIGFAVGAWSVFISFGLLLSLTSTGQFHYRYVFAHSQADLEPWYRVSAAWAGQEGSFLLWAVTSAMFVALARKKTGADERGYLGVASAFLMGLAGILTFESPFRLIDPILGQLRTPPDGNGLSPALLNYWMVIHPPTIFLGFGSLLALFAWAAAALMRKNLEDYIVPIRPWAIISATLLGLGLCMGGFWAYEMLNWGGFWMWDPVENTSFVPWVAAVAFIHGIFVQQARRRWHIGNAVLAAVPLMAFCFGTFLTRSGFLGDQSVHSFAQMDRSALWILTSIGGVTILGFFGLVFARMRTAKDWLPEPRAAEPEHILNRTTGYGTSIWILLAFGVIAGVGMSVPLIQSLAGQAPKMVEEKLYHYILSWFFSPFMLALAIFPFITWRGSTFKATLGRVNQSLAISVFITGILLLGLRTETVWLPMVNEGVDTPWGAKLPRLPWVLFLSWLCVFATVSNFTRIFQLWRTARPSVGGLVTHVGFALTLFGLVFSRGFEQKTEVLVHPDYPGTALGYTFAYIDRAYKFTDRHNELHMMVMGRGEEFLAHPGLYFTPGEEEPNPVMWPHIQRHALWDMIVIAYPMAFDASGETTFNVGEMRAFKDITLQYEGMRTEGQLGTAGARFFARFTYDSVTMGDGEFESMMMITEDGPEYSNGRIGDTFEIRLDRIDAATKSATVTLFFVQPAYPVELFYKPLTIFVWIGVGVMTLGGFWAARSRSRRTPGPMRDEPTSDDNQVVQNEEQSKQSDAPEPITQG